VKHLLCAVDREWYWVELNACSAYAENLPHDESEFHERHGRQGRSDYLSVSSAYAEDMGNLRQSLTLISITADEGAGCAMSGFSVSSAYA
jgi:hypothetical protein